MDLTPEMKIKNMKFLTRANSFSLDRNEKDSFCQVYEYFNTNYPSKCSYNKFTTYCKEKVDKELRPQFYEGWLLILLERREVDPPLFAEKLQEFKVL